MEFCCGWERLLSVFESFVSNCKWHSTVQIQSLIAAHKSTDRGEWSCVVLSVICYTEQYIANMVCLMATNYSVGAKLYSTFELRVHTNGGQMEYGFFNPPLLTSFFYIFSSSELHFLCACKIIISSVTHRLPFFLPFFVGV